MDGYKFVVTRELIGKTNGPLGLVVSTVQFYENQNGNAVPAKC